MRDVRFLNLNGRWVLAYDRHQWVLQRRRGKRSREQWRPVSFVATDRRVLLRVLRENGVEPTPEAQALLETLPETFRDFLTLFLKVPVPAQKGVPEHDLTLTGSLPYLSCSRAYGTPTLGPP